jgi:uncharacterized protein (TIRG00374 family)
VRHRSHSTWNRIIWTTGIVLLAGTAAFVAGFGEERQFMALLRNAAPGWLLVAAALQSLTYVCTAGIWWRALARQGESRPLRSFISLGLAKLFTDQTVPSAGLSGMLLIIHALGRRGISRDHVTFAVLVGLFAYYIAYVIVVTAALVILWAFGDLNWLLVFLASGFSILAIAIPLGAIWLQRHPHFRIPSWFSRLPGSRDAVEAFSQASPRMLGDPVLITQGIVLQIIIFLLDASTLGAMLHAMGTPAGPAPVFASFIIASVVATVMVVPGGIGTFEGTSVAMLHVFGVPLEAAFAATVLLRGFTFWLPMLPGLWLARREML